MTKESYFKNAFLLFSNGICSLEILGLLAIDLCISELINTEQIKILSSEIPAIMKSFLCSASSNSLRKTSPTLKILYKSLVVFLGQDYQILTY